MTTAAQVVAAIRDAQAGFSGWDWTEDFAGPEDYRPVYYSRRPDDDVSGAAAEAAREYDDEVQAAADRASSLGDAAIAAVEAGNYTEAAELLARACREEAEFGDCPAYRQPRLLAEDLAEDATGDYLFGEPLSGIEIR